MRVRWSPRCRLRIFAFVDVGEQVKRYCVWLHHRPLPLLSKLWPSSRPPPVSAPTGAPLQRSGPCSTSGLGLPYRVLTPEGFQASSRSTTVVTFSFLVSSQMWPPAPFDPLLCNVRCLGRTRLVWAFSDHSHGVRRWNPPGRGKQNRLPILSTKSHSPCHTHGFYHLAHYRGYRVFIFTLHISCVSSISDTNLLEVR